MIVLHGNPSSLDSMEYLFKPLVYLKHQVFAIDMPGFGESTGSKFSGRSDAVLEKDNAADVVNFVMKTLNV